MILIPKNIPVDLAETLEGYSVQEMTRNDFAFEVNKGRVLALNENFPTESEEMIQAAGVLIGYIGLD